MTMILEPPNDKDGGYSFCRSTHITLQGARSSDASASSSQARLGTIAKTSKGHHLEHAITSR